MPDTFGARLRQLRDKRGLSQPQLAEKAGLTSTAVAMLERGERQPAWQTVLKLSRALGVTPNHFR